MAAASDAAREGTVATLHHSRRRVQRAAAARRPQEATDVQEVLDQFRLLHLSKYHFVRHPQDPKFLAIFSQIRLFFDYLFLLSLQEIGLL